MQRLVLWLYGLLLRLATPLLRRKLRRRAAAEPGYALAVEERFGHYTQPADAGCVWIHAVSLGETRAAAILLAQLRAQLPGLRLLLTHGTATGRAEGTRLLQHGDVQVWQPWDTPRAVRRFLQHFRPAIGILMETEVWPCLVDGCRKQGVPLVLANARLNAKSRDGALRLAWLARPAYAGLAAIWAQTEGDAERLRQVGAHSDSVRVLGNLKFDVRPNATLLAQGRAWRAELARPVLLLASSREGEEAMWLQYFKQNMASGQCGKEQTAINNDAAAPQWLIVPRHPQRFDEVAALCQAAGLSVARRSQWDGVPPAADVWLGDTLGEMALYYGLADVALLGGSFAPLGGQNLIEAAACGCPIVLGPHTFNFAEAAELALQSGAAQRAASLAEGASLACALARDAARHRAMQASCQHFAQAHIGAARAMAQALQALLARQ